MWELIAYDGCSHPGSDTDGEEVPEDGVLQGLEIKRMQRGQQCSSEGAAVRKEEERQDAAGRWGKHAWRRDNQSSKKLLMVKQDKD